MKIKVQIKSSYGKSYVYPACEISKGLIKLLAVKTFTQHHIDCLKELGYELEVITPTL